MLQNIFQKLYFINFVFLFSRPQKTDYSLRIGEVTEGRGHNIYPGWKN